MLEQHYPTPDFGLSLHRMELSILCCISLFFLLVRTALKLRSLHLPPLHVCRIAVFSIKSTLLSLSAFSRLWRVQDLINVARDPLIRHAVS